ncbi:MCE family protein [Pandoraea nosoerga]|uniref:ABC transporter substrate-binding protein n=1 Tax=Pandoraea nosoerga TaxID=2508296 RepID=A0A5E4RUK9_9BURK|nr:MULTISPECIES: MlaD family protein [Pandoraea]MBN4664647.1 MCE family protein [Pandoraea nosoerga]MBN4674318.1 MCE family protein [Pandoraea nosoerga]MBN4679587.1 MCE family protein [Pandoraea nosoerga]MBN4743324.1 MCE family protein [Pandoraea nosoerga]VVD66723.1 ABC transporter substrate-binding protein [Pandoraea nosoerga]
MENKSHAFMAGLFTLVLLAAVAAAVYWFNRDNRVRVPYELVSHTNVNGLNPESVVRYRGLAVGKVDSIKFDPRTPGQILIRILVNEGTPMTKSTFATLSYQGVTGLAFVQLDDDGHDRTLLPSSEAHVAQLRLRPSFIDELQRRGNSLVRQLEEASSSVNQLLSPENRQAVMDSINSVKTAAQSVNRVAQQLEPVTKQLPDTVRELNGTLAGTHRLTQQLSDPQGPLVRNLDSVGRAADQAASSLAAFEGTMHTFEGSLQQEALPRLNTLSDDLRFTAQAVGQAAQTINRNPRALLFGTSPPPPGPGESGFSWPAGAGR